MLKYSDWMNFMTYDLHGIWDASNPIGSIVQGHTNLTEIQLATELLWRNNVPPNTVVLGFGFYGRSFTLADPSCSKPGCPFSGASNPGRCFTVGAENGIGAYLGS
jgi:chitinase